MKYPGNAMAAVCCLLASSLLAWWGAATIDRDQVGEAGQAVVTDAGGHPIPVRDYQRIACASTIAAELAPELVGIERVVLVPDWFMQNNPRAFRYHGRDGLAAINIYAGVERLLTAEPDIVFINSLSAGGSEQVERLRELGLTVCDLGSMHGLETFRDNLRIMATALNVPQRGENLAAGFTRRLQQVAAQVPHAARKQAIYLGTMGGSLVGGTEGSSYHDLLRFAGLIDAAAGRGLESWPTYSPEQVLALDPAIIVTEDGRTAALAAMPGFDRLRAIREGGIVELPPNCETVALGLLPAAEHLCDAVYGPPHPAGE